MFISLLTVNTGEATGRLWLGNRYRVHQRLCMAFPSAERKERDPAFLCRYKPGDFLYAHDPDYPHNHVHGKRTSEQSFLFRIDTRAGGNPVIVVQSAIKPDWDYAFHNAGYLLACAPQIKDIELSFTAGDTSRFWLHANPTKRLRQESLGPDGKRIRPELVGKRVPVPVRELKNWLGSHAEKGGFVIIRLDSIESGSSHFDKSAAAKDQQANLYGVRFEGVLKVLEPAVFAESIIRGIGPGKAFGFGLLSVAPVRD